MYKQHLLISFFPAEITVTSPEFPKIFFVFVL